MKGCYNAAQIEKVYLVEINPPEEGQDYTLNLECIFELNHKSKDIRRGEVQKSASIDERTDPMDTTLRIT